MAHTVVFNVIAQVVWLLHMHLRSDCIFYLQPPPFADVMDPALPARYPMYKAYDKGND